MTTKTVPEFRLPWTSGAYAYPEADTFAAALDGFKRRRKDVMFHMSNTGEAGKRKCALCGIRLSEQGEGSTKIDKWSTWTYSAKRKQVGNGMHYGCSWQSLLTAIFKNADALR